MAYSVRGSALCFVDFRPLWAHSRRSPQSAPMLAERDIVCFRCKCEKNQPLDELIDTKGGIRPFATGSSCSIRNVES